MRQARESNLDLVEIAPTANPPVCRVMDFAKYKYEQDKREREAKKHHHEAQLKEIRMSPRIDDHDYKIKLGRIEEFLQRKDKVRVRMFFRGREIGHQERGRRLIEKLIADIEKIGKVDKPAQMLGKTLVVILAPK